MTNIIAFTSVVGWVGAICVCCLAGLDAAAAKAGGARLLPGALRVPA
jgi:hypothetical protein